MSEEIKSLEEIKKEVLEEIHNIFKIDTTKKYENCIEKAIDLTIQKTAENIFKEMDKEFNIGYENICIIKRAMDSF